MTPKTPEGKILTMLYALFGVPLMLMCLSSLGGFLADALQCAYSRLCRGKRKLGITDDDDDTDADKYGDVQQNRLARAENDEVSTECISGFEFYLTTFIDSKNTFWNISNCRPTAIYVNTMACAKI